MHDLFEKVRPYLRLFFNNPKAEFISYVVIIFLSVFFLRSYLFSAFELKHTIYFIPVALLAIYLVFIRKQ